MRPGFPPPRLDYFSIERTNSFRPTMMKKKKKNQRFKILEESQKNYFLHKHHTIHFERSIKYLISHTIDACQNYRTKNFPAHSHHDHAIETKRKNYSRADYTRASEANENLFRLRVTPTYVSPRLSSPLFPPCYTRELTRARVPGRHVTRTHARTH